MPCALTSCSTYTIYIKDMMFLENHFEAQLMSSSSNHDLGRTQLFKYGQKMWRLGGAAGHPSKICGLPDNQLTVLLIMHNYTSFKNNKQN